MEKNQDVDQVFEAVVGLPVPVRLEAEVAGKVFQSQIGGVSFTLVIPAITHEPGSERPTVIPPKLNSVKQDVNWAEYLRDPDAWGSVDSWYSRESPKFMGTFFVGYVLLRREFASDKAGAEAALFALRDQFFAAIDSWLAMLIEWLEVVSEASLTSSTTVVRQEGQSTHALGA